MRSSTTHRTAAALLGAVMLAGAAQAGSQIEGWSIQQGEGQEQLRLRWSEPAAVQIDTFPSARQAVVTIPGAALAGEGLPAINPSAGSALQAVRIQPVTLTDGREGARLTLTFSEWREPRVVAGAGVLTVSFDRTAAPAPDEKLLSLSNDDLASAEYGSGKAPATGAGQAPASTSDWTPAFYVPDDLTAEEKAEGRLDQDIGLLATMDLFDRFVDLDFKDADLQDVIRTIASKLGLNIIIQPSLVQGSVTVTLTNVRLGDALEALLKSNELSYKVERGGIVRIVPRDEVQSRDKETVVQSIALNWIQVTSVVQVLEPFLSEDVGQLQAAVESNVLLVEDVPEKVAEIQRLLERIDIPEKQVKMEVRMVDMTEDAGRRLGFRTDFTSTDYSKSLPDEIEWDPTDPTTPFMSDAIRNATRTLTPDSAFSTGAAGTGETPAYFNFGFSEDVTIFGNSYQVDAQLSAEEERREAVILANPTVLSLNNTPATIEIKRQIPYFDAEVSTEGSARRVNFKDVGTKVEMTPLITNNGYVRMTIIPEQIIQVGTDPFTNVPITDERNVESSVIVKDEQTIALGGLRQFEARSSEVGMPWLMRAPVLSWLFKDQTNSQRQLEMYLFVTPHIVKDPEPSTYEMGLYEKIDYNWDLPDYFFDEVDGRKSPKEEVAPPWAP